MALAQKIQEKTQKALGAHPADAKISKSYFSISFIALLVGGVLGLLQGLNRAGLLELPTWLNYYQVLTGHGLFLVLVFTSFFVVGYFYAALSHNLGGLQPKVRKMVWSAFWLKIMGAVTAVIPIIQGEASVMYTFYPPMARHLYSISVSSSSSSGSGWPHSAHSSKWRIGEKQTKDSIYRFYLISQQGYSSYYYSQVSS